MRGTKSKLSFDSIARSNNPTKTMIEKQQSPAQKPVRTSDIATSIGVNVPMVGTPTTFRIKTTTKMPSGKTISHFNIFCSKSGKLYTEKENKFPVDVSFERCSAIANEDVTDLKTEKRTLEFAPPSTSRSETSPH